MNPLPANKSRLSSIPYRKSHPLVVVATSEDGACREYTTHLLDNGFAAATVGAASEAVGLATRLSPEAVVFDLDPAGIEAATRLRREPLTRHIGLVAVSPPGIAGHIGLPSQGLFDVIIEAPCSPVTLLTELLALLARAVPNDP